MFGDFFDLQWYEVFVDGGDIVVVGQVVEDGVVVFGDCWDVVEGVDVVLFVYFYWIVCFFQVDLDVEFGESFDEDLGWCEGVEIDYGFCLVEDGGLEGGWLVVIYCCEFFFVCCCLVQILRIFSLCSVLLMVVIVCCIFVVLMWLMQLMWKVFIWVNLFGQRMKFFFCMCWQKLVKWQCGLCGVWKVMMIGVWIFVGRKLWKLSWVILLSSVL